MAIEPKRCRSCQAAVLFVPSATTGKLMILDAEPCDVGNIVIRGGKAEVLKKRDLFGNEPDRPAPGEPRYLDHHSTCPSAGEWRKRK